MKSVAIIGSGIAGLGTAWLLRKHYRVQVFESGDHFGGHTNTFVVEEADRSVPVDTGFIVYNEPNYPNLTALFDALKVNTHPTVMSFGVTVDEGRIEYAGSSLNTLFAQRRNLARPGHWKMLGEILRFNSQCKQMIENGGFGDRTVGTFIQEEGFGAPFRDHYLLPMAAAIWSCPTETMLAFPLESFAHFFRNHGLLDIRNRPQWRSVLGGSHEYVRKILHDLGPSVCHAEGVKQVVRKDDGVELLLSNGSKQQFDKVVIATHADQALGLLQTPTDLESQLLQRFRYQENRAYLHNDPDLMPQSRLVWSAWNYLAESRKSGMTDKVSVTYWMNRLQQLDTNRDYFVSLNPNREPKHVHASMLYEHPVFDEEAMQAQTQLHELQGQENTWFCGSYFGYGFHEDALTSAVGVAASMGIAAPWLEKQNSAAA